MSAVATLRLLGMLPPSTREQMVRMYRSMLTAQVDALSAALDKSRTQATDLAHKIAGSAGMMQDQALSSAARAVEAALREGRHADALACWPDLHRCASEALAALDAAFPGDLSHLHARCVQAAASR